MKQHSPTKGPVSPYKSWQYWAYIVLGVFFVYDIYYQYTVVEDIFSAVLSALIALIIASQLYSMHTGKPGKYSIGKSGMPLDIFVFTALAAYVVYASYL